MIPADARFKITGLINIPYKITKTICNFFNGEKILSDGKWKEDMDPARIKDVFHNMRRYAKCIFVCSKSR